MKDKALTIKRQKIVTVLALIALIAGFLFLQSYFILIAVAMILAFLFNPVYEWSLRKFNNKNGYAITITVIAMFLTVAIPLSAILYITAIQASQIIDVVKQTTSNSGSIQEAITSIVGGLNAQIDNVPGFGPDTLQYETVFEWLKGAAQVILATSIAFVKSFAGGIAGFFTNLIIFLFVFSSLLKNQKKLLKALQDLNPLGPESTNIYLSKMGAMTSAMVKGQFTIAILQGLSGTISLWMAGSGYLAFWFMLLSFLSIIPLGGGIILIPLGIILVITGNIWQGLVILGFHFIITTNIDNILRPKFVPKSAQLDPALVILSVFAGLGIFGFLGIVLGPVIMIVILTAIQTFLHFKRTGKLPIAIDDDEPKKKSIFSQISQKFSKKK